MFLEFAAGQLKMDCGPQFARGPQFGHSCYILIVYNSAMNLHVQVFVWTCFQFSWLHT